MDKYFAITLSTLVLSITNTYAGTYELDWGMPDDPPQVFVYGESSYTHNGTEYTLDPNLIYYMGWRGPTVETPYRNGTMAAFACGEYTGACSFDIGTTESATAFIHFMENSYAYDCIGGAHDQYWPSGCSLESNYTENRGGQFLGFRDDPSSQVKKTEKKRIYTIDEANAVTKPTGNTIRIKYR